MPTRKSFTLFAVATLATLSVSCSPSIDQHVFPSIGSAAHSERAMEHLYVIVTTAAKSVAEYPIKRGIPEAKPDRVVRGFVAPNALTVDGAGRLYVLDLKTIKEFSAGASGHAKPIREIRVPSPLNIDTLAVDASGYVYVGQKGHVLIYAPDARGHAKPVAVLKPVGYPAGLTIDAGGSLYALGNTQKTQDSQLRFQMHVSVYSAAPKFDRIREFCTHELAQSGIDYGVALGGRGRLFTTHTYFIGSLPNGEIDVYHADSNACPINPKTIITTMHPTLREPVYVAVEGHYLYVADVDYGNGGVVFTLSTTGRRQTPLGTLAVANNRPHDVFGIAVGP